MASHGDRDTVLDMARGQRLCFACLAAATRFTELELRRLLLDMSLTLEIVLTREACRVCAEDRWIVNVTAPG